MIFKNNDEKNKNTDIINENDSFWDLSLITPKIKQKKVSFPYFDTQTQKVTLDPPAVSTEIEKIDYRDQADEKEVFSLKNYNDSIESVRVFSWRTKYSFYEKFKSDAKKYYHETGEGAEYTRFFSYLPNYSQMTPEQKKWYFFWRNKIRNGEYVFTDSSYILLYIFEIINLDTEVDVKDGLISLCKIWRHFRTQYTKLDRCMSEWIVDYCLVHRIQPNDKILNYVFPFAVKNSQIPGFYFPKEMGFCFSDYLVSVKSPYDFTGSKYITKENKDIFATHIYGAVKYAFSKLAFEDGRFSPDYSGNTLNKTVVRDSFCGAVCVYDIKKRIEVKYKNYSFPKELLPRLGDLVKYCENKLRSYLGIRARLLTKNISERDKEIVDEYFSLTLNFNEKRNTGYIEEEEERKPFSVSFDEAEKIEEKSWETTNRLVEDMTEIEQTENIQTEEEQTLDIAKSGLIKIVSGDMKSLEKLASENYMMTETLVECINELCYDIVGDVAIEYSDGEYKVATDYEQEIKEWLRS